MTFARIAKSTYICMLLRVLTLCVCVCVCIEAKLKLILSRTICSIYSIAISQYLLIQRPDPIHSVHSFSLTASSFLFSFSLTLIPLRNIVRSKPLRVWGHKFKLCTINFITARLLISSLKALKLSRDWFYYQIVSFFFFLQMVRKYCSRKNHSITFRSYFTRIERES